MKTNGHFLFLGTGGSMGIPVIGCKCPVCKSESPCNQRLRPSGLITINKKKILIDCGPDFRLQALHYHIDTLDGIIFTHAHHDHVAGIDELRVYNMRTQTSLPCLLSKETADDLMARYPYIFKAKPILSAHQSTSSLNLKILEGHQGEIQFLGFNISYVTYEQAGMKVNGFRMGNFAYISDIRHYSDSIFDALEGVEILVLSALRYTLSDVHFTIDEAIVFATRVGAKQTWFTHIAHELDHEACNARLPYNVRMAYDGLELHFVSET